MFTGNFPVPIYYAPCREDGCWVLFKKNWRLPSIATCRLHNHELAITCIAEGIVTEFEAHQGWTRQKPD